MQTNVITDPANLVQGAWYLCGFEDLPETEWSGMPIYKYKGDGCWSDDDGEPVDRLWDAELQLYVGINHGAYIKC